MEFDRKRWDSEVRGLSIKCLDLEFVEIMHKINDGETLTEAEEIVYKDRGKKYIDSYGMMYISNMNFRIEHDSGDSNACLAVCRVLGVLEDEEYWKDIYSGDKINSEEAQNRLKLREGLKSCLIM